MAVENTCGVTKSGDGKLLGKGKCDMERLGSKLELKQLTGVTGKREQFKSCKNNLPDPNE